MIQEPAAIEHNLADALALSALGDQLSDFLGAGQVAAAFHARILFTRRRSRESGALPVVNHLRINMFQAPEYRQARPLLAAFDFQTRPLVNAHANVVLGMARHYFAPAPAVLPAFLRS